MKPAAGCVVVGLTKKNLFKALLWLSAEFCGCVQAENMASVPLCLCGWVRE